MSVIKADPCLVPDCVERATTTFAASAETLTRLGFQMQENMQVRMCTRHYLIAMDESMRRAGVPKEVPPTVEYWCPRCETLIPVSDVSLGASGGRPTHVKTANPAAGTILHETHVLQPRVLKAKQP